MPPAGREGRDARQSSVSGATIQVWPRDVPTRRSAAFTSPLKVSPLPARQRPHRGRTARLHRCEFEPGGPRASSTVGPASAVRMERDLPSRASPQCGRRPSRPTRRPGRSILVVRRRSGRPEASCSKLTRPRTRCEPPRHPSAGGGLRPCAVSMSSRSATDPCSRTALDQVGSPASATTGQAHLHRRAARSTTPAVTFDAWWPTLPRRLLTLVGATADQGRQPAVPGHGEGDMVPGAVGRDGAPPQQLAPQDSGVHDTLAQAKQAVAVTP